MMTRPISLICAVALAATAGSSATAASSTTASATTRATSSQASATDEPQESQEYEAALVDVVDAQRLAQWHASYSEEVHVAGDEGDARMIDKLRLDFEVMGLEVEVHRFRAYLPQPVSASLQIVAEPVGRVDEASGGPFAPAGEPSALPLDLPLRERAVAGDAFATAERTSYGWNAYAASGDVTAEVVYANYGRKEDFAELEQLGVDVEGKIVLARYGGNYRGYKAKFAQEAGAVGLVIFSDPHDSGYRKGAVWPVGGYANETYIQRGSILTLDYPGDPLTPFVEANDDAVRLDPAEVDLPEIPVQPIGWGAAWEIVRRMTGDGAPAAWQGALPSHYRLGGDGLRLRLRVEQERRLVGTANVIGTLRGTEHPEQWVLVGSHHDAWSFGAGDPNAGSMLVTEAARAFAAAARRGKAPKRSVVFAHWGAEEFGIIGSTEWVEGKRSQLERAAVAYLNLDMATMGTNFGASASPSLKTLMEDIAKVTDHPAGGTIWDAWNRDGEAPFGDLGGGSDHVAFYCHAGIPSASAGAWGAPGVSYHSNYENLDWYRATIGDDYRPAEMLASYVVRWVARLADSELLPLGPSRYGDDFVHHLGVLAQGHYLAAVRTRALEAAATGFADKASRVQASVRQAVRDERLDADELLRVNQILLGMERLWLIDEGIPDRPWYRNLFAATDADSGYAPWMLPALRWTVERDRPERWPEMELRYLQVFHLLDQQIEALGALVPAGGL